AQTNALGYTTAYDYNFAGRAVRSRWPDGSRREVSLIQTAALPDPASGLGTRTNPMPAVINPRGVFIDGNGNPMAIANERFRGPTTIINALGFTTAYERDGNSNITEMTLPNGVKIRRVYDAQGNMLSFTNQATNGTTSYTYDTRFNKVTTVKDPNGNVTTLTYDARGNVTAFADALGNRTQRTYDARGLMLTVTDALNNATTLTYDSRGNLSSYTNRLGEVTRYEYDPAATGNAIRITDGEGRVKAFTYDLMNRLTSAADPLGNITRYTYDAVGNVINITDARGNIASFDYDVANRLTGITNPLGQAISYSYDANGNLKQSADAEGQVVTNQYDALNRVSREILPDETIAYEYDPVGNLAGAGNDVVGSLFIYDGADHLIQVTVFGGDMPEMTIRYAYDATGNRVRLVDPQGGITSYDYDALNRLTRLTNRLNQTTRFTYDARSQRTQVAYPNGISTTYGYNNGQRLTSLLTRSSGSVLLNYQYTYDRVNNILTKTDLAGLNTFAYDGADRLISAMHPQTFNPRESFTYDTVGNRLTSHLSTGATFNEANRLVQDDRFVYTYDANGNLLVKEESGTGFVTIFTYNALNQLKRIDFPDGGFAEYSYDGMRRRVKTNINGTLTKYVYDGVDILLELDERSAAKSVWTFGLNIDEPISVERDGQALYYHADDLGSIRMLTDVSGRVVQTYDYDSFGRIVNALGPINQPFLYTAREWDAVAGLYYYRARYYSPEMGRFLSEDPVGSINLYAYIGNSPIRWVDPFGLDRTSWYGDGRSTFDGPKNGNWGGKNWSGGWNPQRHGGVPGPAGPTDSGDECYMNHDNCWGDCSQSNCSSDQKNCMKNCDRQLVNCLRRLDRDPRNWPRPPRPGTEGDSSKYRDDAIWYFK
ncbi:MAG: hypothetical protein HYR55_08340, partial [Acidobacteria bacterium]|nr:hypothetical protein [Acidobacteriota bacterium]